MVKGEEGLIAAVGSGLTAAATEQVAKDMN